MFDVCTCGMYTIRAILLFFLNKKGIDLCVDETFFDVVRWFQFMCTQTFYENVYFVVFHAHGMHL